jgi:hypothetical protein
MIARPDHLTIRPNVGLATVIDTLSELLQSVRLAGAIFSRRTLHRAVHAHTEILAKDSSMHPGAKEAF